MTDHPASHAHAEPVVNRYTPGPWTSDGRADGAAYTIEDSDGRHVASAMFGYGIERAVGEANARLIAAAPDLLEALEKVRRWIDRAEQHLINHGGKAIQADHGEGTLAEIDAVFETAIAKARGEG